MSEVTLHGQPVNVGDKVWSIEFGACEVKEVGDCYFHFTSPNHKTIFISGCHHPNTIFWQPISPEAIEAAKVKPKEPEYEYQWVFFNVMKHRFETTDYFSSGITPNVVKPESLIRIEESKREVKP
jgi:hypothetical protein